MLNIMMIKDPGLQYLKIKNKLDTLGDFNYLIVEDTFEACGVLKEKNSLDIIICDISLHDIDFASSVDGIRFISLIYEYRFKGSIIIYTEQDISLLRIVEDMAAELKINLLGALDLPVKIQELSEMLNIHKKLQKIALENHYQPFKYKEIKQALVNNSFTVYYQPKVLLKNGDCASVEALCRWKHKNLGLVSPMKFIPLMEQKGLIHDLTYKLFDQVLDDLSNNKLIGHTVTVGFNVSPVLLSNTELPDIFFKKTKEKKIDPALIILEITENTLIQKLAKSLETLGRLKMRGFNLSIDDFGTGYSNMQQLNRIPFSELKIDQSFVTGCYKKKVKQAILKSNVHLAHELAMITVAEGVSSKEEWAFMRDINCTMAQGYLVAEPMAFHLLEDWHNKWSEQRRLIINHKINN